MSENNNRSIIEYIKNKKSFTTVNLSNEFFNSQTSTTIINNDNDNEKYNIGNILNTLYDIHSALKQKNLIVPRNAHNALSISNNIFNNKINELSINTLDNVLNMLNCVICQELCRDAVYLICCGQIYCNICILQWVSDNFSCPLCRAIIDLESVHDNIYIRRIIKELKK